MSVEQHNRAKVRDPELSPDDVELSEAVPPVASTQNCRHSLGMPRHLSQQVPPCAQMGPGTRMAARRARPVARPYLNPPALTGGIAV